MSRSKPLRAALWVMSVGLVAAPLWPTYFSARLPIVTVGRLVLFVVALGLSLHFSRHGIKGLRRASLLLGFSGVAIALAGLIAVNAETRGCYCAGAFPGYLETVGAIALIGALRKSVV